MLIKTKFYSPPLRKGLVCRSRLLSRLGLPAPSHLTLIYAPAGYGKTTLTRQWLEELKRPYAWLSLDEHDNNSENFWRYIAGTLNQTNPALGNASLCSLEKDGEAGINDCISQLLNDLTELPYSQEASPLLLVLDDFHEINDLDLLQRFSSFLDKIPSSIHVVITSRTRPEIGIPKRRARNTVVAINSTDLSFETDETRLFFSCTLGIELDSLDIEQMCKKTEGWIAALQLAGLSLHTRHNSATIHQQVESFNAGHQYITEFFIDEMLNHLSQPKQTFLVLSSCLPQLSSPICNAALCRSDSDAMLAGKNERLATWLKQLPSSLLATRPKLLLIQAWNLFGTDRILDAEVMLETAEKSLIETKDINAASTEFIRSHIAILRSQLARIQGKQNGIEPLPEITEQYIKERSQALASVALLAMAVELYIEGNLPKAQQLLKCAAKNARKERNDFCVLVVSLVLSQVLFQQGETGQALSQCASARKWLLERGQEEEFINSWQYIVYVDIYRELDDLDESDRMLTVLMDNVLPNIEPAHGAVIQILHAALLTARAEYTKIPELLHQAQSILDGDSSHWSLTAPSVSMQLARNSYRQGSKRENRWLDYYEPIFEATRRMPEIPFSEEESMLLYIQIKATPQTLNSMLEITSRIGNGAKSGNRCINIVRSLITEALIFESTGHRDQALTALKKSLDIAEKPGYRRLFLDEGDKIAHLFNALNTIDYTGWWSSCENRKEKGQQLDVTPPDYLETLTSREKEVLTLVGEGLSNQGITDNLSIALNTTKAHIRNIYEKLMVNRRTEAVAVAKQYGFIN